MKIPDNLETDELEYIKRSSYLERINKLLSALTQHNINRNTSLNLLEIGCRTGMLKRFLTVNQYVNINFFEVDIDLHNISLSNNAGFTAKYCNLNTDNIPFDDDLFDIVISFEVIEHLPFYHNHFIEIKRVLKNNGIFLLTTPNIATIKNRINFLLGKDVHQIYTVNQNDVHYRMFTRGSLEKLITMHGFEIIEFSYIISKIKSNKFTRIKHLIPSFRDILYVNCKKNT